MQDLCFAQTWEANKNAVFIIIQFDGCMEKKAIDFEADMENKAYICADPGLALVKRGLELSDGHITVESKPQIGTTFTVFMPLSESNGYKIEKKKAQ